MWIGLFNTLLRHSRDGWVYANRKGDEWLITDGAAMYRYAAGKGDVKLSDGGEFCIGDYRWDKYPPVWEKWAALTHEVGQPIMLTPFCVDQPNDYFDPYDNADNALVRIFAATGDGQRVYVRQHYVEVLGDLDGVTFTFTRQLVQSDIPYYHVIAWQDEKPVAVFASMAPEAFAKVDECALAVPATEPKPTKGE
jgi:hypothetical protein